VVARWGHFGAQLLIICIAAILAIGLRPPTPGTALAVLAPVTVFFVAGATWLAMRAHDRRLCEVCMAAMPLDASALAARYRRRFQVAHVGSHRMLVVAYLVVLVGSDVALRDGMTQRLCWALIQSSMIYLVLACTSHRKYQPWCPQCRGGDGTSSWTVPEPLPSGGRLV
jgi:hypothetical protein